MRKVILVVLMLLPFFVSAEIVKFSDCVDGDTIKVVLKDKKVTVRLLAIDTPESVHPTKEVEPYGVEASEYTCNLVMNTKKIELEYDGNSDKYDKYGRILAWVFVDNLLLQDEIVKKGYGKVAYLYGDYKYTKLLEEHQNQAIIDGIGIWSNEDDCSLNMIFIIILIILFIIYMYLKNKFTKRYKKSKIGLV